MSVVVRMEMPEKCGKCPLAWYDGAGPCFCMVTLERNDSVDDGMIWKEADPNERPSWCPIICQLPEGHGRLVFHREGGQDAENHQWEIVL